MSAYPPALRKNILSHAGLRDMRYVNRPAAIGLVRVLQGGDKKRRSSLIRAFSVPLAYGFENYDDLSPTDCVKLISPGSGGEVLPRARAFAEALTSTASLPVNLVDLLLADTYLRDMPLSSVALALLVDSTGRIGPDAAEVVRAGWRELRAEHSELPETPVSLQALRELIPSLPIGPSQSRQNDEPAKPEVHDHEEREMSSTGEEASENGESDSIESLKSELGRLCETFVAAADAAERVWQALTDTERPADQDVDLIVRGMHDFDRLRTRLESVQGSPLTDASCDGLRHVLGRLESADAQRRRILPLAEVSGPPALEAPLQQIREAAAQGSPVVEILADLVHLAGDPGAIIQISELQERFRKEAPAGWLPVALAATLGQLVVPAEANTASHDGDPQPSPHEPPDEDGGSAPPPTDEPEAPPSSPAAAAAGESAGHDELADLDTFLRDNLKEPTTSQPARGTAGRRTDPTPPESADTAATNAPTQTLPETPAVEVSLSSAASASVSEAAAEAEASALRAGRFGLAAWLRAAEDRPAAEVSARRCAAIAADMSEFSGRLSAAFAESASKVSMKALADDTPGQLLTWAAAVRTGLIHPTLEAAQLLEDLSPALFPYPGLTAYGHAFSKVAQDGAYLLPGLSGRMHDASQAESDQEHASAAAVRLLEEGPSQTIKFAPATDVWKFLLQDDSSGLGKLLSITARNEVSRVREVRQDLDFLRSEDQMERLIDRTARARASSRGSSRIHSGARAKLIEKIDKALDLVANWITAISEVESLRTDDSGMSWVVKPLNELRGIVNRNRTHVEDELAELERSSDTVLAAAAVGASMLIHDTLRLLDGGHLPQSEPLAAHVLNGDLLLSPEIRLDPDTLAPLTTPALDDLLPLCAIGSREWREAFKARAHLGDHEGTRALLNVVADQDPALATELRQRREKLIDSARHERDHQIEEIQDRIAEWRRDGVLPEAAATRFSARLQVLGSDDREDFGAIARALRELEQEAAMIRDDEMAAELERLTDLRAENADVAAVSARISAYIRAGDLTTAREFTAQAKAGNRLPEISEAIDHLDRFFPHFPQSFEDMAARLPGQQRGREGAEWVQRLKDALHTGNEVSDPDLENLLLRTGLSISAIPRGRRGVAEYGVRMWQALAQGPKAAGNLRSAITAILQLIGLEGDQGASREEQNRLWITLDQARTIGEPLLPAFGSRMSPSGDRLRLLLVWKPPGPQQVIEWLKDQPQDQTVLVFYFGVLSAEQRRHLAMASRRRPSPVAAVLDHVAVSYLACLPDANWTSTVSLLAPFTATNPYAPTGDVPEEMFYGRSDQLQEVTGRTGSSFVYGGRQLGKSALLRKAERNVRKTDENRKVISEVIQNIGRVAPVTALWPMLAGRLSEAEVLPRSAASLTDPQEICREVKEWIAGDPARQLLILLDEADEFLNKDARDASFSNVIALRNLMDETNRRVKVVFAGLHQTARFQSLPNQPLAHLGTPIAVGPLDPQDAYNLLTKPLAALGFRFPARLAARVIAEANNAPALIQLFADALLTRLRRISAAHTGLPYEITREDVEAVWRDNKLARGFRDRFEWTLNLDKRYKVIAYTVAFHALDAGTDVTMTANQLRTECQEWWPQGFKDASNDGFRGLLEECVNLGVLAAEGERYRLRTPHILNLLGGADEVEAVLGQAETFELPDSFDAQSYRDAYKGHGERSPLTGSQVTRLLSPRNVLHLIAGSPALQIDRVATALEEAAERHKQAHTWRVGVGGLTFDGAQQRAAQSSDHDIIIVDLSGLSHMKATAMARTAARAISMPAKGTLAVVLISPSDHASQWVTTGQDQRDGGLRDLTTAADLVELQRFNRPGIRQWMHEVGLGFQDEPSQDALLRATGGWPVLISRVIRELTDNGADREHALEACRTYVRQTPAEFVRLTGVLSGKAISAAWHTLVEQTEIAEGSETLADLLALAGAEEEGHPLSEPSLQEEGFVSTADLVEVLRILGALVAHSDGKLRLEPVVLEATQRMGLAR
ncbi:hypothetical protein N5079_30530 [Planotetraspora sp. A-T 1434]|uniref:nSTAND1 domain-containing NTPase n=1 Tax=Planotetraspora sp. A-T 1434 TaxID=2979219 RepID=UPI0021BE2D5B|nr:hypothetical protein [Planotetraspora sp. A-T 1434]MCT9934551.1 hypothetical protein [Planotetraspora sp. A-T 1434]